MSTVELTRRTDGPALVETLAQRGLRGEIADDGDRLIVQVEDCDEKTLAHALEDWIRERGLPLVPVRLGDCTFAVSPPAA